MRNYRSFLTFAHKMPLTAEKVEVEVTCPAYPAYGHFDSIEDRTAVQKAPSDSWFQSIQTVAYHRFCTLPEP